MEESRRAKLKIMWIGVTVTVIVIFALWLGNLGNAWQVREPLATESLDGEFKSVELSSELSNIITDFRESLFQKSSSSSEALAEAEKKMKELMEDTSSLAEERVASSSEPSETPLESPDQTVTCPSYINCMPSIGEARPCQIPAGCEGITQIAY